LDEVIIWLIVLQYVDGFFNHKDLPVA
jgi:hypothetical protein